MAVLSYHICNKKNNNVSGVTVFDFGITVTLVYSGTSHSSIFVRKKLIKQIKW